MCFSNSFIEQQTNKMTDEIRKNSLYKFVRVEYIVNESMGFQKNFIILPLNKSPKKVKQFSNILEAFQVK